MAEKEQEGIVAFCPGCGDNVSTYEVKRDGVVEVRCNFCGLTLEQAVFDDVKETECILVAEDSELIRLMLNDALVENNIARKIVTSVNGFDFVTKLTDRFEKREPVDLVILDIQMPIMSGINAALALRAIETGFQRENRRIPILFFSVKKCDDTLLKVMKFCTPAQYVNKGTSDSKEQLFGRIKQVLAQLLK